MSFFLTFSLYFEMESDGMAFTEERHDQHWSSKNASNHDSYMWLYVCVYYFVLAWQVPSLEWAQLSGRCTQVKPAQRSTIECPCAWGGQLAEEKFPAEAFVTGLGFLVAQMVKRLPAVGETLIRSLGQEDSLEKWQPTPVFLPGKYQGQRSLAGYSPWGCKESDTTEPLHFTSALRSHWGWHGV